MNFKEWLNLNEIRFKGLYRQFRQEHPWMPQYVAKDVYRNRHGFTMKRLVNQSKTTQDQASQNTVGGRNYANDEPSPTTVQPRMDIADPDQTTSYNRQVQQAGFYRTPSSMLPSNAPSKIFNAHNLKYVSWTRKPVIINVDPSDFTNQTQEIFLHRDFGYRGDDRIRDDENRTAVQRERYPVADGKNEPVIVLQQGRQYDLLEGWHRTMTLLLAGCPEDQHNILKDPNKNSRQYIDFSKWREVPIQAYVGFQPNRK